MLWPNINFSCPKGHLVFSHNSSCYDSISNSPVPKSHLVCAIICLIMTRYHFSCHKKSPCFAPSFIWLWLYCLVLATKLSLAAIGLVFPVLVLGYKSFNCSMYHVPVPTLFGQFVWLYFKQLLLVAGSATFLTYKLKESPKYLIPIPLYLCNFVWLSFKQLVCVAGSIIFGIQTWVASNVSNANSYLEKKYLYEHILNSKQLVLIFPALVFAYEL